jgi:hypothetical protein
MTLSFSGTCSRSGKIAGAQENTSAVKYGAPSSGTVHTLHPVLERISD